MPQIQTVIHKTCPVLAAVLLFAPALSAQTGPGLFVVSGNGQVLSEFSSTTTTQPLVAQARDAAGNPVSGVTVSWAITDGEGTIVRPSTVTDANGLAKADFLSTALQAGYSFKSTTVTASTAAGSVDFYVTTVLIRLPNGGQAAAPIVELLSPVLGEKVSGPAGSVVPGAIEVRVTATSGPQSGVPIRNVGAYLQDAANPTVVPLGVCNGPGGIVLTDSKGVAICDLVLGPTTGTEQVIVSAGGSNHIISLQVTPGQNCAYTLSPASQAFGAIGGTGTLNIGTTSGCGWAAASNASWIVLGATTSGNGNGSLTYTVVANTGAARTGTITAAGKTTTVTQTAAGTANPLVLTTTSLPSGFVGTAYSVGISATGGTPPYTWSSSGSLPPGLSLGASTGVVSGAPSTAGVYAFSVSVKDSAGVGASQSLSLTVTAPGSAGGSLGILSTVFPNPVVGTAYQQALTTSGGCVTPFSPTPVFSLASGQLPPGLAVQQVAGVGFAIAGTPTTGGTFTFTIAARDACGNVATANVTVTVAGSSAVGGGVLLLANPAALTFTAQAGGTASSQVISLSATSGTVAFTASASTNWLTVTATGSTPATIQVAIVNSSTLTPGIYNGTVTVAPASGSPLQIPVTLT
ncbi:MAG: beta strand repeat-containing protein, partial [Bryobacteraceae bacterium]